MPLLVAAVLLVVGGALTAWGLPELGPQYVLYGYAALFLPYAITLWWLRDGPYSHHALPARATFIIIAVAAVVARIAVLPAYPLLSDDLFRYVWEGRVVAAGYNPFVLAPDAAELASLRDETIWPFINHREIPTIYPPVSQAFFALNALFGGGLTLMKALLVAFEAAMVALVWRATRDHIAPFKLLLAFGIYALNPLVILEVAWSGHLDVIAWGSLVAGLVVWQSDPELRAKTLIAAGVLVGVSISAKLLGVLALPFLVTGRFAGESGWLPRALPKRLATVAIALVVVAASYLPFADAGGKLFAGFGTYAATWRSNEGGYRAVAGLTQWGLDTFASDQDRATPGDADTDAVFRMTQWNDHFMERGWTKQWQGQTLPNTSFTSYSIAQTTAKALAAFLCGLVLLWLLLGRWQPLAATGALLLTLYAFAPTVHPWYVAWLVPFAALRPRPAPIAFSALVLVGYGAWLSMARGGPWAIEWWAVSIEYGLVAAILLLPNKSAVIVEDLDTFQP